MWDFPLGTASLCWLERGNKMKMLLWSLKLRPSPWPCTSTEIRALVLSCCLFEPGRVSPQAGIYTWLHGRGLSLQVAKVPGYFYSFDTWSTIKITSFFLLYFMGIPKTPATGNNIYWWGTAEPPCQLSMHKRGRVIPCAALQPQPSLVQGFFWRHEGFVLQEELQSRYSN